MTVAWFSYFPVEWLSGVPEHVSRLPRQHPASWQRTLLAELERVQGLKLHVLVLRKHFEGNSTFERNGVVFHLIKTLGGLRAPSLFWHDTLLVRRELRIVRPDVVHAWGTEKGAALVAMRLGLPAVVTIQGLMAWMAGLFALSNYERVAGWLERYSLARLKASVVVTAESPFSSRYLKDHYPHLAVRRVDVVPDALFHRVDRQPRLAPRRIVYNAQLGSRKGGDTLLLALDRLRTELPFELVVIGGAAEGFVAHLKAVTSVPLWEHVRWRQNLTSEEVARELSEAALLACPTRADTGPMAAKEAVVAGVPVVGSAVGGLPDYVVPGKNGLLFSPGNVDECVAALRSASQHPLFRDGRVDPETLAAKRLEMAPEKMGREFLAAYEAARDRGPAV